MARYGNNHVGAPRRYENQPHTRLSPPSYAGYANGCRCDECRAAKNEYRAVLRQRNREAAKYALALGNGAA